MNIALYRRIHLNDGRTVGQAIKNQSDFVMEQTWDRDLQSRKAYIYDYYSDDSIGTLRGLRPQSSNTKVQVDIKFITTQHGTISRDQVEYHIMFKPSHKCPLPYYRSNYDYRYGMEYPIGLYIDIPDDQGVYRKWLICSRSYDPHFVRYSVLPCNFTFRWIDNNHIHAIDGIARLRNSYNSGVWRDYLTTTVENQDQLWLPLNEVTTTIFYGQRFLISPPVPNPTAWKVTKVETLHPIGIYKVVVSQDLFDAHRDLVDLKRNILIADFYREQTSPIVDDSAIELVRPQIRYSLETPSKTNQLKINGQARTYRFTVWGPNGEQVEIEPDSYFTDNLIWAFEAHGEDKFDALQVDFPDALSVSVQTDDLSLLKTSLTITAKGQILTDDGIVPVSVSREVEVVGL